MNDQELSNAVGSLSDEPRNGICTFELANDCPSGWGVIIASAGVNFYYKDGSSETVGPRPVNLSSGQNASFASTKPGGCVKKTYLAMTVVIPGEGASNMTHMTPDAGEGHCYIRDGIILGPKKLASETQSKLSELLTIRSQ